METERKSITLELKAEEEGAFTARIATLDVIDHDGDIIRPGSFPKAKELPVSAYQHTSWNGALPVGKAVIRESGVDVLADGLFNLKTSGGRDTYEAVKFAGSEWSFGFKVTASGSEKELEAYAKEHDGARPYRIITKVEPYEISPVLLGAGINTQTLGIKAGLPYADEAEMALAAVNAFAERTKSLADLRRKEGRDLSEPNKERIVKLAAQLGEVKAELERLAAVTEPTDEDRKAIDAAYLRFLQLNCKFTEVR